MIRSTVLALLLPALAFSQLKLTRLTCDNKENPVGIATANLLFSWQIGSAARGVMQSAYTLELSEDSNSLKTGNSLHWQTGRKPSTQSILVPYTGRSLRPAHKYFWRVRVWDQTGASSAWSSIAVFTTALDSETDWSGAKWIGYEELPDSMRIVPGIHAHSGKDPAGSRPKKTAIAPYLRTSFTVNRKIKEAFLFVSGLGHYEFSINGTAVGKSLLAPGWTWYEKRVYYNSYEITHLIREGRNAAGAILGSGFYNVDNERYYKLFSAFGYPKLRCRLVIRFTDGTEQSIVTGEQWKTARSPITYNSIYGGEDYDARLEQKGWNEPAFDDQGWKVVVVVKPPSGKLESEPSYPVTVRDTLDLPSISQPAKGKYVYDFKQNASGIIELKVKGRRGQKIELWPAELLTKQGLANQQASGNPYYFTYTLKGDGIESWRPKFTYYGFRYVQVSGAIPDSIQHIDSLPGIVSLSLLHTTSSAPQAGNFTSGNDQFNRINQLILWAIRSNTQSVITDCPHREKLSWLEQDHLMGESIHFNTDLYHLYRKLVYDMIDAQTAEGLVPDIAPEYVEFVDGFRDSPEWGSSAVILPWMIYKWYGDKTVMKTAYPMMKKYTGYLKKKSSGYIVSHGLGDWFDYGPRSPGEAQLTPKSLTATAIYFYDVRLLAEMARILGKTTDANALDDEARAIMKAFNGKFFDQRTKIYSTGSQTAIAMPYCVGLVPDAERKAVFETLISSIEKSGKALTAGDVGFHYLIDALREGGASGLIYEMNARSDVPGYGFQLKKGATALTESWPALEEVSNNHLMLGHIMQWFYDGLGGIGQSEKSLAYQHLIIKPAFLDSVASGTATYQTPYGTVSSSWKKVNGNWNLHLQLPPNTKTTLSLPATSIENVRADQQSLTGNKDIRSPRQENGRVVMELGSGEYHFKIKNEK